MKRIALFGFVVVLCMFSLFRPTELFSSNLTSVKDLLQTSRLSINARVDVAGTTVGGSNVRLKTSASSPAYTISTANLKAGDVLTIGTGSYTVVGIIDSSNFTVTPVILTGDQTDNNPIYLKEKPQHVVTFNTATAVPDGFFQILLPANASTPNDAKPDYNGYDFGGGTVDVVATNATGYTFVTGVATVSGATRCTSPVNYQCFEVHYSGSGGIGTAITIKIGNTNGTNTPIAPSTGATHTEGTADTYSVIIKNFAAEANPNTATPIDQTTGKVSHIEAVRITATVDPTINFTIAGVSAATTVCGTTSDVDTLTAQNAPLAVPFGTLILNTFSKAAHKLTVSTNAAGGYAVTASENQPLGKDGASTPNIPDSLGNGGAMSESASAEWTTSTINGFGYSLQNITAASVPFQYTTATGNCTGTFCARQFADNSTSETPQTIMSSTTVANAEQTYVCYHLNVGATQAAGDYENQITYTATGTF